MEEKKRSERQLSTIIHVLEKRENKTKTRKPEAYASENKNEWFFRKQLLLTRDCELLVNSAGSHRTSQH